MIQDRFSGEAAEPPVVRWCDFCGNAIRQGCGYYEYENNAVCDKCAKRFSWFEFLAQSKRRTAGPENWL